jgi:arginine repressor
MHQSNSHDSRLLQLESFQQNHTAAFQTQQHLCHQNLETQQATLAKTLKEWTLVQTQFHDTQQHFQNLQTQVAASLADLEASIFDNYQSIKDQDAKYQQMLSKH